MIQHPSFRASVIRRHVLSDQVYYLFLFEKEMILSAENNIQNPKYVVSLNCNNFIKWNVQEGTLKSFGLIYKDQLKYFEAQSETLTELRRHLANKLFYKEISDMYEPLRFLGQGGSSKVYLIKDKFNPVLLASKCIDKSYLLEDGGYNALFIEIECMLRLQHPNIIRLHEVFEGEKTFYMILDYLKGNSLNDLIFEKKQRGQFSFEEIKVIIKQILLGVQHMHNAKIMHRDLKPENIMFMEANDINSLKIVDFGLATSTELKQFQFPKCGTPGYVAPEIANMIDLNQTYSKVCDVFSIGAIFYKLITLKELFPGHDHDEALKLNKKCHINLTVLNLYKPPPSAIDLIKKMLDPNPTTRIQVDDALKHQYFQNNDNMVTNTIDRKAKFQQQNQVEIAAQQTKKPLSKSQDFVFTPQTKISEQSTNEEYDIEDDDTCSIPQIPILNKRMFQMNGLIMKTSHKKQVINGKKNFKKFNTNDFHQDISPKEIFPSFINMYNQDNTFNDINQIQLLQSKFQKYPIDTINEKQEEEQKN